MTIEFELLETLRSQCKIMTNRCFLRCPVWEQSTHHFPNHKKHHDRFKAWVEAIDRTLETDEDYEYFRTKRLCHIHFIPMYCYNNKRLSPLAIPTLYLTKESRNAYWAKDLELRKSILLQSKSSLDEISKDVAERPKDEAETPKDNNEVSKDKVEESKDKVEVPKDKVEVTKAGAETQKNETETNNKDPVMDVPEKLPSNVQHSLLQPDVQESLVNLLIADILQGENENYTDDVQDKPMIDLSLPSPVQSNILNPVADIIIEYVPTTEVSAEKLLIKHIPRDITTSEEVESFPEEPFFIHDLPIDSTLLETCAEEIEINFDSAKKLIQKPKKKRKSKYDGISCDPALRITMEHNYSKASIVASTSHMSSNGVHPKKTIIALKSQVRELRKKLKFYKQKYKDLLSMNQNQQTVTKQIRSKIITKISQKGQTSHKKAYKNGITYLKLKNVGGCVSLPRNT